MKKILKNSIKTKKPPIEINLPLPMTEEIPATKPKSKKNKKSRSKESLEVNGLLDEVAHKEYLVDKVHPYSDTTNKEQQ